MKSCVFWSQTAADPHGRARRVFFSLSIFRAASFLPCYFPPMCALLTIVCVPSELEGATTQRIYCTVVYLFLLQSWIERSI